MQLPTLTVNYDGVEVVVSTKTPRTEMYRQQLINRVAEFNIDIAQSLGVDLAIGDMSLMDYVDYSVLCIVNSGEPDFEFASMTDDKDTIRQKFEAYLDTAFYPLIQKIERAISTLSRPNNDVTAPNNPQTDEKKSTKGKSTKTQS